MRASRIPSQLDCQTWLQGGGGMCSAEELLRGAGGDGELNEDGDGADSGLEGPEPEPGPGPTPGKTTEQEGGSQSLLACLPEQQQQQQQAWQRGRPRQPQQRGLGRGGQEQPEQGRRWIFNETGEFHLFLMKRPELNKKFDLQIYNSREA
ncbi:uncharacterized protein FAM241A isoform 3-T4 [Sarcophilus harrisii]